MASEAVSRSYGTRPPASMSNTCFVGFDTREVSKPTSRCWTCPAPYSPVDVEGRRVLGEMLAATAVDPTLQVVESDEGAEFLSLGGVVIDIPMRWEGVRETGPSAAGAGPRAGSR